VPTKPRPSTGREVGIDLGLTALVATSDGERCANPRHLAGAQRALARAQRRVSRRRHGSNRRRKAVRLLAKRHTHVAAVRRENHIKIAHDLVARYDLICHENLNICGLAQSRLARAVGDAGWASLLHWIACKAEEAGRETVGVNPNGTSQQCSACEAWPTVRKDLSVRVHRCEACGYVADRDVNAARNILRLGRSLRRGTLGCNGIPETREGAMCPAAHCPTG